ncbi:hypothetical protein DUI70_1254 [Streptomyces albus]|nr:hypothetical protein SLNHY_1261 [Streptomyces albus]AYN31758.1 hypothetical protein DUI70_1254 [Streptomyces albus]
MRGLLPVRHLKLREVERLDAHVFRVLKGDSTVAACHDDLLC